MKFRANGKLMLTGEYLALLGATALALPVRFGQDMTVAGRDDMKLVWKSHSPGGLWFTAVYTLPELTLSGTNDITTASTLMNWIRELRKLSPDFLGNEHGFTVTVSSDYPLRWGLGSSATLAALISKWAGVDPFRFHELISRGSGADIACTLTDRLIKYRKTDGSPVFEEVTPGLALKHSTWFCYLGNHRGTAQEVESFLIGNDTVPDRVIRRISALAEAICSSPSAPRLEELVREHEAIISGLLGREPVGERFPGFPGSVKSLGAWGGDFAMFVSNSGPAEVELYLDAAGLKPVFRYNELAAAG